MCERSFIREPIEAFVDRCKGMTAEEQKREFSKRCLQELKFVNPRAMGVTDVDTLAQYDRLVEQAAVGAAA